MHSKSKLLIRICFTGDFCSFSGRVFVARLVVPDVCPSAAVDGYDDLLQLLVYRHISLVSEHLGRFLNKKLIQNEEKMVSTEPV